jgi:outer membrane protein assembly factor BamE
MFGQAKTQALGNAVLAFFDFRIDKFFHVAAVQAHDVVVVCAFVQFKHGLASLEVVALEQAGLLKLGEHAVDRGQTNVDLFGQQDLEHILGAHVALVGLLKDFQDFQARRGGLQAAAFQVGGFMGAMGKAMGHVKHSAVMLVGGCCKLTWGEPRWVSGRSGIAAIIGFYVVQHTGHAPEPMMLNSIRFTASAALAIAALGACALYKPEIRQGNVVTQEQIAQLRKGLTRNQVQAVMGAPLLTSNFHDGRWDYVYRVSRGNDLLEQRKYVLRFKGDALEEFGGDPQPTEFEAVTGKAKAQGS